MGEANEKPWDGRETVEWRAAVDTWEWHAAGDDEWSKSGPCPRCTHQMTVRVSNVLVHSLRESETARHEQLVDAQPPADDASAVFARCDCGVTHSGRPKELTKGCGASAYIGGPA